MSSNANKEVDELGCLVDVQKFIEARLNDDSFESFVNFILCAAMAALDRDNGGDLVTRAFGLPGEAGRDMRRKAQIVFSVNGVALPFEETMRRFHEQWDLLVLSAARRLLKEKLGDHFEIFHAMMEGLREDFGKKLGIALGEDD